MGQRASKNAIHSISFRNYYVESVDIMKIVVRLIKCCAYKRYRRAMNTRVDMPQLESIIKKEFTIINFHGKI